MCVATLSHDRPEIAGRTWTQRAQALPTPGWTNYGQHSTRANRATLTSQASRRGCESWTIVREDGARRVSVADNNAVALKNADQLLNEVMQAVDIDGNGRITEQGGCLPLVQSKDILTLLPRIPQVRTRNRKGALPPIPDHRLQSRRQNLQR